MFQAEMPMNLSGSINLFSRAAEGDTSPAEPFLQEATMGGGSPTRPALGGYDSTISETSSRASESRAGTWNEGDASTAELENEQLRPVGELLQQIHDLDTQDSGIWAKHLLVFMVVLAGFLSLLFPHLMWDLGEIGLDSRYLPQFFFGLTALAILHNAHVIDQRKRLRVAREEMVRQLLRAEFRENQALIDPLTQVYNRRYLDKILRLELGRADRAGTTLAVMIIDLDGFKAINTHLGHLAGDQILREAAELLNRVFRRSDTVIRYGGDEFLILMPDTNEDQAAHAIDRLQHEREKWQRRGTQGHYAIGFSCGVATYLKGAEIKEVIQAADKRMYEVKATHHAEARLESRSQAS